ncbi:hypothetical protein B0T10DRAFT_541246 [Thelonectria olida]|uniref:Heterokaryon incompatibility domain-containing protein n=1 Tax=Thelonectria olida TaxID=1576542 RepID=A0A9P9AL68_9HYPO|nr:hypothetical protein B0T10DRAFT_541246 [Thelonectria olida]
MLCDKCTPMFQSHEWGSHHPDLTSLIKAAEGGCDICEPLMRWALKTAGDLQHCIVEPTRYRVYRGSVDLTIRHRKKTLPLSQAVQTTQNWMSDCLTGHQQCQKNLQSGYYPTRLLELGESTLHVILTEEDKPSGPYASLSYCWGANPSFLFLTALNLPRLQAGIPYSDLPIAFREAVDFAKLLSIRYLWIDSLCIIQSGPGSTEDWHSESAKMQAVYSNCILNISLSRATNPDESCMNGRSPSSVTMPFELETRGLFRDDGDFANRTCIVISPDHYREALYNQPLGFRAWALQERLLATRVLSFGQGELFWDCMQMSGASESFPAGVTEGASLLDIPDKAITSSSDLKGLSRLWQRILEEYTVRDLTHPELDKLVALSAVAKGMGREMDDVYIAGHFFNTLPQSLNWRMEPFLSEDYRRKRPVRRRINRLANEGGRRSNTPSWSWASMDGQVFQHGHGSLKGPPLAEVDAYSVTPVDEANPEGQVASASVRIRAYWAEVEWEEDSPVMLANPKAWIDDVHYLDVMFDDPDDNPGGGTRLLLAVIAEDNWLHIWSGLVLKEVEMEGETVCERIRCISEQSVTDFEDLEMNPYYVLMLPKRPLRGNADHVAVI